jgi:hypothetical protein
MFVDFALTHSVRVSRTSTKDFIVGNVFLKQYVESTTKINLSIVCL